MIYGIRPEHVFVGQGGVVTQVAVIEPTGAETQLTANIGTDVLVATVRERLDVRPGDALPLVPDVSKLHLFEAESGKRLTR